MNQNENASEIREKIQMYFDKELNDNDQKSLLKEVKGNPEFQHFFDKEKKFRSFIKSNVTRSSVSPDLIQTIKSRIKIS